MSSTCVYSFCLALAILSFSNNSFAQVGKSRIIQYDTTARPGKVVLIDGSEITGKIVFNDNDGIIIVRIGNDDTKSFNAKRLISFQFYVSDLNRVRHFYCMEFPDPKAGTKNIEIFEVLKELGTFAVLSKIDRLKTQRHMGSNGYAGTMSDRQEVNAVQTETVYFVNSDGLFEPYMGFQVRERQGDILDTHRKGKWLINSGLFKKYTAQHYDVLADYAKQNKLSFKDKEDLIKILNEYEKLTATK